jgi:glutamyl-tRNA reductase
MTAISELTACCWSTVSLGRAEITAAQEAARAGHPDGAIVESCQRTEAYVLGACNCAAPLRLHGVEALFHLAEVAAGLHSVVLGEAQILGQVRIGFEGARGPLRRWADFALATARELRRETNFNSHAGALLDRGLKAAGVRPGGRLLVLGAGQMGRLVAERGRSLGFSEVVVAARRPMDWPVAFPYVPLGSIAKAGPFDVVAGCLGSGANPISPGRVPAARLLLDLGTPQNFCGSHEADVLSLADLLSDEEKRPHAMRRRRALRKALRAKLEARLVEERFDGRSAVGNLRAEVEAIRVREVERMRRLHPELPLETIEVLTRSLVNQLFHAPSERLKAHEDEAFGNRVAALFARG